MAADVEGTIRVELELPTVLEPIQIPIPVGCFDADPGVCVSIGRAPAASKIDIAIVSGQVEEGLDSGTREVSGGEIDRVVAFADVKCSAVYLDGTDTLRNQWIRVSV